MIKLEPNEFSRLFPNWHKNQEFRKNMFDEFKRQVKKAKEYKEIHESLSYKGPVLEQINIQTPPRRGKSICHIKQESEPLPQLRWDAQIVKNYLNNQLLRQSISLITGKKCESEGENSEIVFTMNDKDIDE